MKADGTMRNIIEATVMILLLALGRPLQAGGETDQLEREDKIPAWVEEKYRQLLTDTTWEEIIAKATADPEMENPYLEEVFLDALEVQCFDPRSQQCVAAIKYIDRHCRNDELKSWLRWYQAQNLLVVHEVSAQQQAADLMLEIANQYPATSHAGSALTSLSEFRQQKGQRPEINLEQLASGMEKFVRANPKEARAGAILEDRLALQGSLKGGLTDLESLLKFYKANSGAQLSPRLKQTRAMLRNLHYWPIPMLLSLIVLFLPLALFVLARIYLFNETLPLVGKLPESLVRWSHWAFALLLLPLAALANLAFNPGEIVLVKLLARPFVPGADGRIFGARIAAYALALLPMFYLMLVKNLFASGKAGMFEPEDRRLPWYLPRDWKLTVMIFWGVLTLVLVLAFYFLLGPGHLFTATSISVAMIVPSYYLLVRIFAPFYSVKPIPEGAARRYVAATASKAEVKVRQIYSAKYTFKLLEGMLLPSLMGSVNIYLDPEVMRNFSREEFQTILLHQLGHARMSHRKKMAAAGAGIVLLLILMTVPGALVPFLHFLIPGWIHNILVIASLVFFARWDEVNDLAVDQYVIKETGLFQAYIDAILKLKGVDPGEVINAEIDSVRAVSRATRQRIKFILIEWNRLAAQARNPSA